MHPTLYTNRTIARQVVRARDVRLIVAVAVSGSIAAVVAHPVFWLSTAALVAMLAVAQRNGEIDVRDDRRLRSMPLELQRTLRATLAGLPPGDAKRLLNAVGRQAAVLFDARRSAFDDEDPLNDEPVELPPFAYRHPWLIAALMALSAGSARGRRRSRLPRPP